MFVLYRGQYPGIMCPVTGEVVVIFRDNAAGFSKCMSLLQEVQQELREVSR